jgi:glutamine amidotransferase
MRANIGILDYGVGNIGSIISMLNRAGFSSIIISDSQSLTNVEKLIIPGVGSFDHGMQELISRGFIEELQRRCRSDTLDVLGICLGMQLLFSGSDEGKCEGLNLIPGRVKRIETTDSLIKVPHMGWNYLKIQHKSLLFPEDERSQKFYFVHSYHCIPSDFAVVTSTVNHGQDLVASVSNRRIHGVQFHPEKSHKFGMSVLANFAAR